MTVYLFALVWALFYAMHIPIMVTVKIGPNGSLGVCVGAFKTRNKTSFETSVSDLVGKIYKAVKRRKIGKYKVKVPVKPILKSIRILSADVEVSLFDAYSTALLTGVLRAILAPSVPKSRVTPIFSGNELTFRASCIISVTLGKTLIAALGILKSAIKERMGIGSAREN